MTIEGLNDQTILYYACNPVRIKVTPQFELSIYLEIKFYNSFQQFITRFYPINNTYSLELQQWIQLFFTGFESDLTYGPELLSFENKNLQWVNIEINIFYPDPSLNESETLYRRFANGYINYFNPQTINKVTWHGYPFSDYAADGMYLTINSVEQFKSITCKKPKNCTEIYVRWLAPNTDYYYWLFPSIEQGGTTREIGVKDRWFLDEQTQSSNEDTLGLTVTKDFTLLDRINKKYFSLVNTIFTSPEIYILRKAPNQTNYNIEDWLKVRVKPQSFSNQSYEPAQIYSIDFYYPKQYTQTL